jgi:hypothetical protein
MLRGSACGAGRVAGATTRPVDDLRVRWLEHLGHRVADHYLAPDHLGAFDIEAGEVLSDGLQG